MRLFHTDYEPGGVVKQWFSDADGNITVKTSQRAEGIKKAVHAMGEHARGKDQYYLGSVPLVVANQWSRECGAAIGTREFAEYAKKKLMDPDYRALSSGIKA